MTDAASSDRSGSSGETLAALTAAVLAFRDERNRAQFHTPKDVALSLVLEAAEVLERFQWQDEPAVTSYLGEPAGRAALAAELADVLSWVLLLAHDQGIDLGAALRAKLADNARKYPADQARDRAGKYTDYA